MLILVKIDVMIRCLLLYWMFCLCI